MRWIAVLLFSFTACTTNNTTIINPGVDAGQPDGARASDDAAGGATDAPAGGDDDGATGDAAAPEAGVEAGQEDATVQDDAAPQLQSDANPRIDGGALCADDTMCAAGERCWTAHGRCIVPGACLADDECPTGMLCRQTMTGVGICTGCNCPVCNPPYTIPCRAGEICCGDAYVNQCVAGEVLCPP